MSSSRRQAAIDCSRMRPKLTFNDLKHLLGMEVHLIFFLISDFFLKYPGHLEAGEGRKAPVIGKDTDRGTREGDRNNSC